MNEHSNFSSLPPNQEATFVVYEHRMAEAQQKGLMTAIVAAAVAFLLAVGIYLGVKPEEDHVADTFNMSNLTKCDPKDPKCGGPAQNQAAAPAPAPAPAPAAGSDQGSAGSGSAAPAAGSGSAAPAAGSGSAAPAAGSGSAPATH